MKRSVPMVAILMALIGLGGAFDFGDFGGDGVGAPGMEISMPDFTGGALPDGDPSNGVGAPGWGVSMPDFTGGHTPGDGAADGVGAPGWEIAMPSIVANAHRWAESQMSGFGAASGSGMIISSGEGGNYGSYGKYGLRMGLLGPGAISIANMGSEKIDIGSLRVVRVQSGWPVHKGEILATTPHTQFLMPGEAYVVFLQEDLTAGDEVILTNGIGTYTGLKVL